MQIPNEPMHSAIGGETLGRTHPIRRHMQLFRTGRGAFLSWKLTNATAIAVEDFELRVGSIRLQKVVKNGAIRGILPRWLFRRKWRVCVGISVVAVCGRGFEQENITLRDLTCDLPQWTDVVQNPERAAMGSYNNVVFVNDKIAHGSRRQIQLQ